MKHTTRLSALLLIAFCALVPPAIVESAIPEPDFTFYGLATIDGTPLFAGTVTVQLDSDASVIASYTVPPNPGLDEMYVLRVPIDSIAPRRSFTGREGEAVTLSINGTAAGTSTIGAAGDALRLDLDTNFLDPPPSLSVADIAFFEGSGVMQAAFTVTVDPLTQDTIEFFYETVDGTALSGQDYVAASDIATIDPNQSSTVIMVQINGDSVIEPDEFFELTLLKAVNADVDDGTGRALIRDDDAPPVVSISSASAEENGDELVEAVFTVNLSRPFGSIVPVTYKTEDGSAVGGQDFTSVLAQKVIDPGALSAEIRVEILVDSVEEPDEEFFVRLLAAGPEAMLDPLADVGQGIIVDDERFLQWIEVQRDEVDGVQGMDSAIFVTASPDGRSVYAAGQADDSIAVFRRSTTDGTLTFFEAIEDETGTGFVELRGVSGLAVSPDNEHVYSASAISNTLLAFDRNQLSGGLSLVQRNRDGENGIDGLGGAVAVVVSPNGDHVYVAGAAQNTIAGFSRNSSTGQLGFIDVLRNNEGGVEGLTGISSLVVTPDGGHVYASSRLDDAVAIFERDIASGVLTFLDSRRDGVDGVTGLLGARSVTMSPDGDHLYVAGQNSNAIGVFERNPASGALTQLQTLVDGVGGVLGLDSAAAVTVDPDGKFVYSVGFQADAVSVFRRDDDPSSNDFGTLAYIETQRNGVLDVDGVARPASVVVSPSGREVYAVGSQDDAVAVFIREFELPTNPTMITSPTHPLGGYSKSRIIQAEWSGARDNLGGSGLDGYSFFFNSSPSFEPDEFVDVDHGADPVSATSGLQGFLDEGQYYLHLRTCDLSGNCASAVSYGPLGIDLTPPIAPTGLDAPGHTGGNPTIFVTWNGGSDGGPSGLGGYSVQFDMSPDTACTGSFDVLAGATEATSAPLGDGDWYAHLCTLDGAGNTSDTIHLGPLNVCAATDEDDDLIPDCVDSCLDVDQDGFGQVGDPSCPSGAGTDCDDSRESVFPGAAEVCDGFDSDCNGDLPAVEADADGDGVSICDGDCQDDNAEINPEFNERCRNGIDDNCDDVVDADDGFCLNPVCISLQLGATAGDDPQLILPVLGACPTGDVLPRGVDLIWGDIDNALAVGAETRMGTVQSLACNSTIEGYLFDTLKPAPGKLDFYLFRETGQPDYGPGVGGRPRVPDSGDCP